MWIQKYSINDFFCGCGGIGLGFKHAGFQITGAWDSNKYAVQTYKENVWAGVKQADIREMDIDDIPKADVWTFGFPCQDLSVAGLKEGMKVICRHCMTEWQFCTGHDTCPSCGRQEFNAANRSGLFFEIMRLLDQAGTSNKNKLPDILMAELEKDVDDKFYIPSEKAKIIISQALKRLDRLQGCHAVITPGRISQRQNGRRAKGNEEPMFTLTTQDLHGIIQNVSLTTNKVAYCCDYSYCKGIGPGTRARRKHVVEYKNEKYLVRKLTPYEYGLLQGFPMDTWKQTVSDSQAYRLFGNAVTVNVSNAIARAVYLFLKKL